MEGATISSPRDYNPSDNYPSIEAIAEINVNTSNFGAQYGNGVATLNVALKSRTNRWHGSLFEFSQNDAFDSLNPFNTSHLKTPKRWNEYGGSVGGPIKKNKLFFFFNYQRDPIQFAALFKSAVPTQAMRSGNFSDPAFSATIFDSTSCSGSCNRTPLNGGTNILLSNQIDPVAAAIQNYYPAPNLPGFANNFQTVVSTPTISDWYVGKVDYQISENNRLSGSILDYPISLTYNADAFCGLGFDCTRSSPHNLNTAVQITDTWTIGPAMINEARISATREHDKYLPGTFGKGFPAKIGLEPAYGTNAPADIFPNITVNSGAGIGGIGLGGGTHADLLEGPYTVSDVVTLIRGKHSIRIGGELDKNYQNYTNWGDVSSGNFTFNGVGSNSGTSIDPRAAANCGANKNQPCTGGGIPYADFLLGDVYGWYVYNSDSTSAHTWVTGAFVQDDFKVNTHLTVNLGVRYQRQSGWGVNGNKFGVFDPTLVNPGQYVPPGTLGALLYGGKNGRTTIENGVNEFAPRVGLAWSPWDKWSFRASYGLFDSARDAEAYTDGALGLGLNPQGSAGYSNTTPAFLLKNGPAPNSVVFPPVATLSPALLNYKDVHHYNPHLPVQYVQEIYFDVQCEMPGNLLLDVGFIRTKGTHLNSNRDINQVPQSLLGTGQRRYAQFATIQGHQFDGFSNYNALQFRAVKRLSRGVTFQLNYAWSKLMDTGTSSGHTDTIELWQNAYNFRANYGPSNYDSTHNFTGNVSYDLPFGEGRMCPVKGALNQVVGGWRLSTVFSARSGIPFTPTIGTDTSGAMSGSCYCGFALFPNSVGNGNLSNPSIGKWFDTSAFTKPPANTFGNSGTNILRGPKYVDLDLNLGKAFRIWENAHVEVRADAFDALNHPNFNLPDANLLSPTAGQITSTTSYGAADRVIQLGARLTF